MIVDDHLHIIFFDNQKLNTVLKMLSSSYFFSMFVLFFSGCVGKCVQMFVCTSSLWPLVQCCISGQLIV